MSLRHTISVSLALAALALAGNALAAGKVGNAAAGKQKAAACAACHGADGNKTLDNTYPRLAGQYADYIATQLKAFKDGARANDPNGMMRGVATRLTDREIRAVAEYAAGLR